MHNCAACSGGPDVSFDDFLRVRLDVLRLDIQAEVAKINRDSVHVTMGTEASDGTVPDEACTPVTATQKQKQRWILPSGLPPNPDASPGLTPASGRGTPFGRRPAQVLKSFGKVPSMKKFHDLVGCTVPEHSRFNSKGLYTVGIPNGDEGALSGILHTAASARYRRVSSIRPSCFRCLGKWDEWLIATITVVNTVTIGLSVDITPSWIGWTFIDLAFAIAFLLHMLLVMYRIGIKVYFCGSTGKFQFCSDSDLRWRWFEFVLVVSALTEVSLSMLSAPFAGNSIPRISIVRLLRLTRITRLLRLTKFRIFNELGMMINGAIGGLRTLLWSTIMIALPLYALALFMHEALSFQSPQSLADSGADSELFDTLPMAFFTIFRCVVGGDCSNKEGKPIFLLISQRHGLRYAFLYCVMMMLMVFGIFNVIAAIFVESTLAGAKHSHISEKRARLLDTQMFAEQTTELVRYIADRYKAFNFASERPSSLSDSSVVRHTDQMIGKVDLSIAMQIQITPEFLAQLSQEETFVRLLRKLDISEEDQIDLFETLDVDGSGAIDLEELVIGLRKLRGDSRKSDVVEIALIVRSTQLMMNDFMESTRSSVSEMKNMLTALEVPRKVVQTDVGPSVAAPETSANDQFFAV